MKPTFKNTVDILVKAYFNDELRHGDCEACAVGNIVYAAGFKRYNGPKMHIDSCGMWKNVFCTDMLSKRQHFGSIDENGEYYLAGIRAINATGYGLDDLAKIEYAFEIAPYGSSDEEWMFNGLMAVVDVLAAIHRVDLTQKEQAKLLFQK